MEGRSLDQMLPSERPGPRAFLTSVMWPSQQRMGLCWTRDQLWKTTFTRRCTFYFPCGASEAPETGGWRALLWPELRADGSAGFRPRCSPPEEVGLGAVGSGMRLQTLGATEGIGGGCRKLLAITLRLGLIGLRPSGMV